MVCLIQSCAYLRTYTKLIQFRRRWWEVWLLGLECLPDLCHSIKNLKARVQKALLKTW